MLSFSEIINRLQISIKVLSLIKSQKRVSFSSSFYLKAGMALEGCLVMPLFLLFMATLLYSLEIVRFQSDVYEAMHQAGSEACFLAYEAAYGEHEGVLEGTDAQAEKIKQYLMEQYLPCLCVEGGSEGVLVSVLRDSYGAGNLEINASYVIKPFIRWLPIGNIRIKDGFIGHGFVGYQGGGAWDEEQESQVYVYITATGSKYHFSEDCPYIKVQIEAAAEEAVASLRNASGGKYYPCESCRPERNEIVYLTQWGNRYHASSDCPALKRTVYVIPLSEAGTRTACSKCG